MIEQSNVHPAQNLNISDQASLQDSQIGGQAGRDLTVAQNQGSGHIFQGVTFNVFGQPAAAAPSGLTRQDYRNRQALLSKVRHYWVEGVLEPVLAHQVLLELGLEERPDAVAVPWQMVEVKLQSQKQVLPSGTQVLDLFTRCETGRNLLILGGPGSGKTIQLLILARELLVRAEADVTLPLPVVFNLSTWAPKRQTVEEWLIEELHMKYQVAHKVGQTWVEEDQLLLLLDGLDEAAVSDRELCVAALNTFHAEHCPDMVVCSRLNSYETLTHRLNFQTAIVLCPLTPAQIQHGLANAGPDFAALSQQVQQDPALGELAKSPLMLNLMITTYEGTNSRCLSASVCVLNHPHHPIFGAYINQMFQRRRTSEPDQVQILSGLSWLAKHMDHWSETLFMIEDLQPDWFATKAQRRQYWILLKFLLAGGWGSLHVGLLARHVGTSITFNLSDNGPALLLGLLGGVLYGLIGGLLGAEVNESMHPRIGRLINAALLAAIFGPIFGWVQGQWVLGVAYAWVYGIIGFLIYRPLHVLNIQSAETLQWSWRRFKNSLAFGLVIGLALSWGNDLYPAVLFGLAVPLMYGFGKKEEVDRKTVTNQGIWKSTVNSGKLFVIVGSLTALLLGLLVMGGKLESLNFIWVNALILGLGSAILGGQGAGISALKHFVLRFLLWQKGHIPWNYARFLDHAAEHSFLQKVGGGYVFIHRAFLDYFSDLEIKSGRERRV